MTGMTKAELQAAYAASLQAQAETMEPFGTRIPRALKDRLRRAVASQRGMNTQQLVTAALTAYLDELEGKK